MKLLVLQSVDSYSWLDTMMKVNFDEHITSSILDVSDCRMNSVKFELFPNTVESLYCGQPWDSLNKGGVIITGVILYTSMYTV